MEKFVLRTAGQLKDKRNEGWWRGINTNESVKQHFKSFYKKRKKNFRQWPNLLLFLNIHSYKLENICSALSSHSFRHGQVGFISQICATVLDSYLIFLITEILKKF